MGHIGSAWKSLHHNAVPCGQYVSLILPVFAIFDRYNGKRLTNTVFLWLMLVAYGCYALSWDAGFGAFGN